MNNPLEGTNIAQFALTADYYSQKQFEAWDIVNQLATWEKDETFVLTLQRESVVPGQRFTVNFRLPSTDDIGIKLFTELFFYYRAKAVVASSQLDQQQKELNLLG